MSDDHICGDDCPNPHLGLPVMEFAWLIVQCDACGWTGTLHASSMQAHAYELQHYAFVVPPPWTQEEVDDIEAAAIADILAMKGFIE